MSAASKFPLSRDERDAIRQTGLVAAVVLGFFVASWTAAYLIW